MVRFFYEYGNEFGGIVRCAEWLNDGKNHESFVAAVPSKVASAITIPIYQCIVEKIALIFHHDSEITVRRL